MNVVELIDYQLRTAHPEQDSETASFVIRTGDVCAVKTEWPDIAHGLLRALATLESPLNGEYRFNDRPIDFSDYRRTLSIKQRIGYIAPDAALISNRTVRENLLLMRYYFEDTLGVNLDDDTFHLCRKFGIDGKLDVRPASLDPMDYRIAIIVRELIKDKDLLVLERPEILIRHKKFGILIEHLKKIKVKKIPIVFFSFDRDFSAKLANAIIRMDNGQIKMEKIIHHPGYANRI